MLCERYGTAKKTPRETLYTFPTARQMSGGRMEDYIACKAGYRASYLCDAVEWVLSGRLDLSGIAVLPDEALIAALQQVRGVGKRWQTAWRSLPTGELPVFRWIPGSERSSGRSIRVRIPSAAMAPPQGSCSSIFSTTPRTIRPRQRNAGWLRWKNPETMQNGLRIFLFCPTMPSPSFRRKRAFPKDTSRADGSALRAGDSGSFISALRRPGTRCPQSLPVCDRCCGLDQR